MYMYGWMDVDPCIYHTYTCIYHIYLKTLFFILHYIKARKKTILEFVGLIFLEYQNFLIVIFSNFFKWENNKTVN